MDYFMENFIFAAYPKKNSIEARLDRIEEKLGLRMPIILHKYQETLLISIDRFCANQDCKEFMKSLPLTSFLAQFRYLSFGLPRRWGKTTLANYILQTYDNTTLYRGPTGFLDPAKVRKNITTQRASHIVFDEINVSKTDKINWVAYLIKRGEASEDVITIDLHT